MKKIGLTGSTGTIGKVLIKNNPKLNFIKFNGDIRNKNAIKSWIVKNKLREIIHLAAIVPIKTVNRNKKKTLEINYIGTKNLVDVVINHEVDWFFFASTSHVYPSSKKKIIENSKLQPISFYGKTKLMSEQYIIKKFTEAKKSYCIGRIFSTTNKTQRNNYLVPDLKNKIRKTKKGIILNNLNHLRDFISVKDVSKIIIHLYKKKINGILNIGTGEKTLLKNIAKLIAKKYQKKIYFNDNKNQTILIANINKLKKIYKHKLSLGIKNQIF
jgi:nucleoside-diphosphate-sugar epimerase